MGFSYPPSSVFLPSCAKPGKVRICLHHSSIPYAGSAPAPGGETKVSTMTSAGPVTTPVAAAFVGSSVPWNRWNRGGSWGFFCR